MRNMLLIALALLSLFTGDHCLDQRLYSKMLSEIPPGALQKTSSLVRIFSDSTQFSTGLIEQNLVTSLRKKFMLPLKTTYYFKETKINREYSFEYYELKINQGKGEITLTQVVAAFVRESAGLLRYAIAKGTTIGYTNKSFRYYSSNEQLSITNAIRAKAFSGIIEKMNTNEAEVSFLEDKEGN